MPVKFCNCCGAQNPNDASYCSTCGRQIQRFSEETQSEQTQTTESEDGPPNRHVSGPPSGSASRKSKTVTVVLFPIALLFWVATIIHDALGFVAPTNAQAIGFDLWTAFVWVFFSYASRRLHRTFWKNEKDSGTDSSLSKKVAVEELPTEVKRDSVFGLSHVALAIGVLLLVMAASLFIAAFLDGKKSGGNTASRTEPITADDVEWNVPATPADSVAFARQVGLTPVPTAQSTINTVATLQQQNMCSEQAEKFFKKYGLGDDYTNHLDATSGVCYIEITTHRKGASANNFFYKDRDILDAFEGRKYASFMSVIGQPSVAWDCHLNPHGQPQINCTSLQEFDDLALRYFGTAPD